TRFSRDWSSDVCSSDLDEAYIDYSARNQLDLYRRYGNVAVLRTLSKIGLAALRVGWLVAHPDLVRELDKVRLPYNLPTLSQRLRSEERRVGKGGRSRGA